MVYSAHLQVLVAATRLALASPPAYLDPGSGSFILQLLVAGILGGLVALRMSWGKIKARFSRRPPDTDDKPIPPGTKPSG
jgi:hypothetical protein